MRVVAIIPARYSSTRLPAKPLQKLGRKSIIEWVYEAVSGAVTDVYVATDDERIAQEVARFGGRAIMTSTSLRSGTDRCAEALDKIEARYDVVINVQGDEPFIRREHIETLLACFKHADTEIATLAKPFTEEDGIDSLLNPNNVKVVVGDAGRALYFSRSPIPYLRDVRAEEWLNDHTYLKHLGIYAFRASVLRAVTRLESTPLERAERLEQLRWLEHGYRITVAETEYASIGIDTAEDLQRAEEFINSGLWRE